jgi:two-component system chemotaxis response regulator CheY
MESVEGDKTVFVKAETNLTKPQSAANSSFGDVKNLSSDNSTKDYSLLKMNNVVSFNSKNHNLGMKNNSNMQQESTLHSIKFDKNEKSMENTVKLTKPEPQFLQISRLSSRKDGKEPISNENTSLKTSKEESQPIKTDLNMEEVKGFHEAGNGEVGLELYKQLKPDLTTMDMLMPVCDGFISLKSILKYDPKAKVIICTEIGQQNIVMRCLQHGAKNFAVKPINKESFLNMIDNILNDKCPQSKKKKPELDEKVITKQLSFDNILIKNPDDTYSFALRDDSLKNVGLLKNDILIIDRLIEPNIGEMVLVSLNKNFVIGCYKKNKDNDIEIEPASDKKDILLESNNYNSDKDIIIESPNNEKYKIICDKIYLVGVITGSVRKLRS